MKNKIRLANIQLIIVNYPKYVCNGLRRKVDAQVDADSFLPPVCMISK